MALIKTDWSSELSQVEASAKKLIAESLTPMIEGAINQAGGQLNEVVDKAGQEVKESISQLSNEIHAHRSVTTEDLRGLVDYAAKTLADTIDDRMRIARAEATSFITERVAHLRIEFENAAIKSRKTLYANLAISVATALLMAAIGIVYKKISLGELDIFAAFRVLLLSAAAGTTMFSGLKTLQNWRGLNQSKKNVATVVLSQLSVFRPNGAVALFICSLLLLVGWAFATFYV